jgi:2-iminoacetate synthase ThiH
MFFPWYATMMLATESGRVIALRLTKMAFGGMEACDEAFLMVSEKVEAAKEAGTTIMAGGSASVIVDRYREHVALNEKRLCSN